MVDMYAGNESVHQPRSGLYLDSSSFAGLRGSALGAIDDLLAGCIYISLVLTRTVNQTQLAYWIAAEIRTKSIGSRRVT
jgi:hypothetical protein